MDFNKSIESIPSRDGFRQGYIGGSIAHFLPTFTTEHDSSFNILLTLHCLLSHHPQCCPRVSTTFYQHVFKLKKRENRHSTMNYLSCKLHSSFHLQTTRAVLTATKNIFDEASALCCRAQGESSSLQGRNTIETKCSLLVQDILSMTKKVSWNKSASKKKIEN